MSGVVSRLCLLAALALAGCQIERRDLLPPRVTLTDLRVIAAGIFEQEFIVRLRLTNANNTELSVSGLRYQLRLNDRDLLDGVANDRVTVPRLGEATVTASGRTNTFVLANQVMALTEAQEVRYALDGVAFVAGGPPGGLPFSSGGAISLAPTPGAPLR